MDLWSTPKQVRHFQTPNNQGKGRVEQVFTKIVQPIIKKRLQDRQVTIYKTKSPGDAVQLAKKLVDEGHDLIVSCGGDGTNHEVVNGMMLAKQQLSTVALGILPIGNEKK